MVPQTGWPLERWAGLLEAGRIDEVQALYRAAIEQLFEQHIARLLTTLDLSEWAVFIISDHGQSWRADEPYHGQTLVQRRAAGAFILPTSLGRTCRAYPHLADRPFPDFFIAVTVGSSLRRLCPRHPHPFSTRVLLSRN